MIAIYARKSTEQHVADEQKSVARRVAHAGGPAMNRPGIAFTLAVLVGILVASPSVVAQCPAMSIEQAISLHPSRTYVVFTGRLTEVRSGTATLGGNEPLIRLTFEANRAWHGDVQKQMSVYQGNTSEAMDTAIGTKYLIVAFATPKAFLLDHCVSGSFERATERGHFRELGEGRPVQ